MENKVAQQFYGNLAEGKGERYLVEARRFIPGYEDIIELVVDLLKRKNPKTILDIGSGVGNVEEAIMKKMPFSKITCIEASSDMAETSRRNLKKYKTAISILNTNILDFTPADTYDAILSNIVLHNVPYDKKKALMKLILAWLNPGGLFVWSDLIKYDDMKTQKQVVAERLRIALELGASEPFAKENFIKEERHDYPLTSEETIELLQDVGFSRVKQVWLQGAFVVICAEK